MKKVKAAFTKKPKKLLSVRDIHIMEIVILRERAERIKKNLIILQ
jgi:hypothetical protein